MNLKDFIKKYFLTEGDFTLSSGKKSNLYFDIKGLMLNPQGAAMVHNSLIELIIPKIKGEPFTVVGMELGGAQIVQFMVARGWNGIIFRKKDKEHGLKKRIEGYPKQGEKIIIVDDVITTGNTVKEIEEFFPHRSLGTFCIIDRTEDEKYTSLFKERDFVL